MHLLCKQTKPYIATECFGIIYTVLGELHTMIELIKM